MSSARVVYVRSCRRRYEQGYLLSYPGSPVTLRALASRSRFVIYPTIYVLGRVSGVSRGLRHVSRKPRSCSWVCQTFARSRKLFTSHFLTIFVQNYSLSRLYCQQRTHQRRASDSRKVWLSICDLSLNMCIVIFPTASELQHFLLVGDGKGQRDSQSKLWLVLQPTRQMKIRLKARSQTRSQ